MKTEQPNRSVTFMLPKNVLHDLKIVAATHDVSQQALLLAIVSEGVAKRVKKS